MSKNHETKAEVQTTKLNVMPVPGKDDVEISEEEVNAAFKNNAASQVSSKNQQ